MEKQNDLMSIEEITAKYKIHRNTLLNWCKSGIIQRKVNNVPFAQICHANGTTLNENSIKHINTQIKNKIA